MVDQQQSEYSEAASRLFAGDAPPVQLPMQGLGNELLAEFNEATQYRNDTEQRWLSDLRQYRGVYEPEVEAAIGDRSKAFLRKTRVKVESVDARLMDLLFPANKERNFSVTETPEPTIAAPLKQKLIDLLTKQTGKAPDRDTLKKAIKKVAARAAGKMATRMDDQLAEGKYRDVARKCLHSGNLFGTGIIKGPLVERRTRVSYVWDDEANRFVQHAEGYAAPSIAYVPLWRWYPDMAVTELEDCRYTWEHHRLSKSKLADLAQRKTFNGKVIRAHLLTHPRGCIRLQSYESELRAIGVDQALVGLGNTGQYDVFERWGYLDAEQLRCCGIDVPEERMHESFFANVWILPGGEVIKAVLQPIEGMRWPYKLYYLDKDDTSIFGDGLATIMRGDQENINAAVRMLLDNTAITAGDQYEVFVPAFPTTANLTDIFPGKVWPRSGGDFQYPAVRRIAGDNHADKLLPIVQMFDANADETTAVPKFSYGDNPEKGAAATMGGLSMLMGQANIALKDFVISWDEGITKPLMADLYRWNMRFSSDDTIKGDFDVCATGAASLVAKEVRAQALAMFSGSLQPEERARVKWGLLTEQKAAAMDLSDIVMNEEEAAAFASDPANQQAMQAQQMAQQLQLATMQGKLAESQAKAAKAETEALKARVEAIYAAFQAAGAAAANPAVAPGGDAILRDAGWVSADQQPGISGELPQGIAAQQPQGTSAPDQTEPASPFEGETEGIETAGVPA